MKWRSLLSRRPTARRPSGARAGFRSPATPVALGYVFLGALWILLSDWAAGLLGSPEHLRELQTLKGWLFVGVTGALLWLVLHGYSRARIRAEEAEARSERRLEEALASLQATFLQVGAREPYPVLAASEGVAALADYAPEELIGPEARSAVELVHPEDRRLVFTAIRASAQDGRGFVFELRVLTRDGASRWVWCKGQPLAEREAVELFLTDVSRLKQLEAQLVQAQGLEALAELAAGVAHDVNNLLTVVVGHAELAEHGLAEAPADLERVTGDLSELKDAALQAHRLNQRLMRLGRPETGEPREVDLNRLVEETVELLRPMLRRRVTLACEASSRPVVVQGDPHQLERVLLNLAVNARDAMPAGGRLVLAAAAIEHESPAELPDANLAPGRYGCLTVADTGTGIPEEHLDRIFEPFFTTKGPDAGTGLGLAVVAGLVEQNRGRILVESAPGEGTTFQIFLPLAPNGGPEEGSRGAERSGAPGSSPVWSWRSAGGDAS